MERDRTLTCEQLVDALDDYLDGATATCRDAAVDAHLAALPGVSGAGRRRARHPRSAARTLEPIEPPGHVWRARARAREPRHAAAHVLAGTAGMSSRGWRALQPPAPWRPWCSSSEPRLGRRCGSARCAARGSGRRIGDARPSSSSPRPSTPTRSRDWKRRPRPADPQLDALTSATLQSSIDDIDTAIGDAREALALEPGDALSQESLLDALGSKVTLLQDTVALLGDIEPATEEQNP